MEFGGFIPVSFRRGMLETQGLAIDEEIPEEQVQQALQVSTRLQFPPRTWHATMSIGGELLDSIDDEDTSLEIEEEGPDEDRFDTLMKIMKMFENETED